VKKIMIRRICLSLLMIIALCAMTGCDKKSASYATNSGSKRTIKVNNVKKKLTLSNVRFWDYQSRANRFLNCECDLVTNLSATTTEVNFMKSGTAYTAKISPSASKLKVYYRNYSTGKNAYDTYEKK